MRSFFDSKLPRYSIRKFSVGAASVLIGLAFMGMNSQAVSASETTQSDSTQVEEASDKVTDTLKIGQQSNDTATAVQFSESKLVESQSKDDTESQNDLRDANNGTPTQEQSSEPKIQKVASVKIDSSAENTVNKDDKVEQKKQIIVLPDSELDFDNNKNYSVSQNPDGSKTVKDKEGNEKYHITNENGKQVIRDKNGNLYKRFSDSFKVPTSNKPISGNSAVYEDGTVTLTDGKPNSNNEVGDFSLNAKINTEHDFELDGEVNLGTYVHDEITDPNDPNYHRVGADGIGFAFHDGSVSDLGNPGFELGIGGLKDAIGFKLDTYNNDRPEHYYHLDYQMNDKSNGGTGDSSKTMRPDGTYESSFMPYGNFINTDNSGKISENNSKAQAITGMKLTHYHEDGHGHKWWANQDDYYKDFVEGTENKKGALDGKFHKFNIYYNHKKNTLTVKLVTDDPNNPLVWAQELKSKKPLAFSVMASTGGDYMKQQFKFNYFNFTPVGVNVIYEDVNGIDEPANGYTPDMGTKLDHTDTFIGEKNTQFDPDLLNDSNLHNWDYGNDGYVLVDQTGDPVKYPDLTDPDSNNFYVYLKHGTKQIDGDKDKDDPDIPQTVKDQLILDITRTINYKGLSDEQVAQIPEDQKRQKVHFDGSATYDKVTHEIIGQVKWDKTSQTVKGFTPKEFTGYSADKTVGDIIAKPGDKNSTITIKYDVNDENATIYFIDETEGESKQNLSKYNQSSTGKYGEAISFKDLDKNIKTLQDAGYELVSNTFKAGSIYTDGKNNEFTVTFKHNTKNISDTDKGLSATVNRVVTITTPDGKVTSQTQTVTFTRKATLDLVTNKTSYGKWSDGEGSEDGEHIFASVDVPDVPGYTANGKAPQITVTPDSKDLAVNITYTANGQQMSYTFVDDDEQGSQVGDTVTIGGKTDQTVDTGLTVPTNYKLAKGQDLPTSYKFGATNTPVTIHLVHGTKDVTATDKGSSATVNRVITINTPNSQPSTINQSVTFNRTATLDLVTNKVSYGNWSENGTHDFSSVDVPAVAGYTASGTVDKLTVTPTSKSVAVTINYTANPQSSVINYVDDQDNVIGHTDLTGVTDGSAKITYTAPEHWVINGGQTLPTSYTFKADGNKPVVVKISHKLDAEPNDKQTVTRTVNITDPQGKVTTQTQTAVFSRTAQKDEVTGKMVYGNWSSNQQFTAITADPIGGYTIQGSAPVITVTPDTKSSVVNITYKANPQSSYYKFVDDDYQTGDPDISGQHAINGVTDQTINLGITIPKNYELANGQIVPDTYTFKAGDNVPITIHLVHGKQDVSTTDKGAKADVTRTVVITTPDGKSTTTPQTVTFTRTATKNLVNGKVTYGNWSENGKHTFASVDVPDVPGYTASGKVDQITVTPATKSSTVTIAYTANGQNMSYTFVDDDNKGAQVGDTIKLTGKTDETVDTGLTVPVGYTLATGSDVPAKYTFTNDNKPVTIHLVHKVDEIKPTDPTPDKPDHGVTYNDLHHTVTRKVIDNVPGQDPITVDQNVNFERSVWFDEVTGKITDSKGNELVRDGKGNLPISANEYTGDWKVNGTSSFGEYHAHGQEGYTASPAVIDAKVNVKVTDQNEIVEINYVKNTDHNNDNNHDDTPVVQPTDPDTSNNGNGQLIPSAPTSPNIQNDQNQQDNFYPDNSKDSTNIKIRHNKQKDIIGYYPADYKKSAKMERLNSKQDMAQPESKEANIDKGSVALPQTGESNSQKLGILGLTLVAVATLIGLLGGDRKRTK